MREIDVLEPLQRGVNESCLIQPYPFPCPSLWHTPCTTELLRSFSHGNFFEDLTHRFYSFYFSENRNVAYI